MKQYLTFIIILLLIVISILYGKTLTIKNENKKTILTETALTKKEKLTKLENIHKEITYFKEENIDRYLNYKRNNNNLNTTQIITEVNIGLDHNYYTHDKLAEKLNNKLILVNKYNYLPKDYIPENLEKINETYARSGMKLVSYAKDAFEEMAKDASKENLKIIVMSTYRSYDYQSVLYNNYVQTDGKEKADTYSARAGYSEHQTGLAADIYNGKLEYTNFEETKEFKWMQQNAHKYGFILRYPKDKVKQTGYQYESWHYRYVGTEVATYIYENKISYDEYYIQNLDN